MTVPNIRVECSDPDLDGNWIEVAGSWTTADLRDLITLQGPEFLKLWERKVLACQVQAADGVVLTTPGDVVANWENLDFRLVRFLNQALGQVTDYLLTLPKVSARLSCNGVAVATSAPKTLALSPPTEPDSQPPS